MAHRRVWLKGGRQLSTRSDVQTPVHDASSGALATQLLLRSKRKDRGRSVIVRRVGRRMGKSTAKRVDEPVYFLCDSTDVYFSPVQLERRCTRRRHTVKIKNQMSALEKLICKDSCADKNEDVDGSQMGWVSSLYARQGEKKRAKRGLARRRRVKGRIEQQSDEGGCNLGQHCEGHG